MVVAYHATGLWATRVGSHPRGWDSGASGVDIFFVISGFVMAYSGKKEAAPFLESRFIRIVPMYWLITALTLCKMLLVEINPSLGNSAHHVHTPLNYVLASFLFIPWRNSMGEILPLLGVGWTLQFEMLFYFCMAAVLTFRGNLFRVLTPVMVGIAAIGIFKSSNWPAFTFLIDPIVLEFVFGVWIAWLVKKEIKINNIASASLGAMGIFALLCLPFPSNVMRPIAYGIPAFCIVLSAVMLEKSYGHLLPRFMAFMGDASYSLYLAHNLCFAGSLMILTRLHVLPAQTARLQDELLTVFLCFAVAIPVTSFLHLWVEKPITAAINKPRVKHPVFAYR